MDTTFRAVCEAAAAAWRVPALAAGWSAGADEGTVALGCGPETRFRVASITKPMTAALVLDLLEPEETTGVWPEDVRIRHLLAHTSGFDGECGDLARFGEGDDALPRAVAELPSVRRFLPSDRVWSYANSGYWLAGQLAAERAGKTYEEALTARVLAPARMESASFAEPDVPGTGPGAAAGAYPRARRPSGGLVATVSDLLRFGRWLLGRPESARMWAVHAKPLGGVYGLGLAGQRVGGIDVWGHVGSYGGFQSTLLVVPAREAVFAGLANSGLGSKALFELEDAFFERFLGARRRVAPTVALPADARGRFAGVYANGESRYEVSVAPDGLLVSLEGELCPARAIGERVFEITEGDHVRERFDFPLDGFGRFGSRLAERLA